MNPALPVAALVGASFLWGLAWWPLKTLNGLGIGGLPLVLVAYAAGGLLLLPVWFVQAAGWRRDPAAVLGIALLGGYAMLAFNIAMIYGEVVRVMTLFYLLPLWGVLGARIFLGEPIDAARWLAVACALGGALLILGGPDVLEGGALAWPDLLAITCGMAFAGNNLMFRAKQAVPVASKVAAMQTGGFLIALPLVLAGLQPWPQVGAGEWLWVAVYGAGWLLVATLGTQWAVTHMEAGRAAILIILELVVAVVSATLIGGEHMGPLELLGGALILLAAVIEARREGLAPSPVSPA